jgi:hypothetical protein
VLLAHQHFEGAWLFLLSTCIIVDASGVDLYENVMVLPVFIKTCNISFHQNPCSGSPVETCECNDVRRDPSRFPFLWIRRIRFIQASHNDGGAGGGVYSANLSFGVGDRAMESAPWVKL